MTKPDPVDPLFVCKMPACFVFCDKRIELHGDYMTVARLYYGSLQLEFHDPRNSLADRVRELARKIQARRGQWESMSISGQGLTLGHDLAPDQPLPADSEYLSATMRTRYARQDYEARSRQRSRIRKAVRR